MDMDTLHHLVESLAMCEGIKDIEAICLKFCDLCELEYYIFAVCNATSLSAPQIFAVSNYPTKWYEGYFENNLQRNDPVVKYCLENTVPITWNKLMKIDKYCDPIGIELMNSAKEKGLIDGLSVPVKAPSGEISIFSLSSKVENHLETRLMNVLPFAQYFSYSILETYLRLNLQTPSFSALTPREKESLFWACEGKTAWEMSKIMEVSERTAIFHLSGVTKKLGAVNRQHAVAKAIMYGLVKPIP